MGAPALERLAHSHVAVFGIGGVGGHACEALVRAGIGEFDLIDDDTVSVSNLNRQMVALHSTIGKYKTEVMRERMLDINPDVKVNVHNCFVLPENIDSFPFEDYDYVVDCIDTVSAKIALVMKAKELGIPVISAMGAGNKMDPTKFVVTDIYKTDTCPLARVMRKELKKRGVESLKVVYSLEPAMTPQYPEGFCEEGKKSPPGSNSFVPAVAGIIVASEVIKDLGLIQ